MADSKLAIKIVDTLIASFEQSTSNEQIQGFHAELLKNRKDMILDVEITIQDETRGELNTLEGRLEDCLTELRTHKELLNG